jgi:hypothetical protein
MLRGYTLALGGDASSKERGRTGEDGGREERKLKRRVGIK